MEHHFVVAVEEHCCLFVAERGVARSTDGGGPTHGKRLTLLLAGNIAFDGHQNVGVDVFGVCRLRKLVYGHV